jgi:hypothetical protein
VRAAELHHSGSEKRQQWWRRKEVTYIWGDWSHIERRKGKGGAQRLPLSRSGERDRGSNTRVEKRRGGWAVEAGGDMRGRRGAEETSH